MDVLNDYPLPAQAREDLMKRGLVERRVDSMVSTFEMAGFDKGIAYRFFIAPVKNGLQSEEFDMEVNDDVEMIQWFVSKQHKPVERVKMLPKELLKFDKETGECIRGLYKEDYDRFKAGLGAKGLPLERWDQASTSQIHTLKSEGIHTVQQFAALPEDRVTGRFPKSLQALFQKAIHFVNAEQKAVDVNPYIEQIAEMKELLARKERQMERMDADLQDLQKKVATQKSPRRSSKSSEESK